MTPRQNEILATWRSVASRGRRSEKRTSLAAELVTKQGFLIKGPNVLGPVVTYYDVRRCSQTGQRFTGEISSVQTGKGQRRVG